MKRFSFSLDRVLAWRRIEARRERLRWEQIRAELRAIDAERDALRAERKDAAARLRSARSALGEELEALDRFRRYVDAEQARLERKRAECERRLIEQSRVAAAKERDVKILEHLRERRLQAWKIEADREIEQQAAEAFLARWQKSGSPF